MQILDGKTAAQAIKDQLKLDTAQFAVEGKKLPHLVAILIGNNGASETYVAAKVKACEEVGFKSTLIRFEQAITELERGSGTKYDGMLVRILARELKSERSFPNIG